MQGTLWSLHILVLDGGLLLGLAVLGKPEPPQDENSLSENDGVS